MKELECLFAWSEYYKINRQYKDYEKCQKEIETLKNKLNERKGNNNRPIVPVKKREVAYATESY